MSKAKVKESVIAIQPSDAKFGVDMDRRWREQYASDPRQLVSVNLTDRMTRLNCEFIRVGITDEGGQPPIFSEKTKKPLLYFPDEVIALMDQLTKYALKLCEMPESDIEVTHVTGLRIVYPDVPGGVPKVSFSARKQVMAENNWWPFQTLAVYLKGIEGSSLILPEGGEKIIESLRLHCMRAVDGEFERPIQQLDLLGDSTAEQDGRASMLDD